LAITGVSDRPGRVLDIVRDPEEQERDVVDEIVGREDPIGRQGDPVRDAQEPPAGERVTLLAEPFSERDREGTIRCGGVHKGLQEMRAGKT
jgi:hypothetical protein